MKILKLYKTTLISGGIIELTIQGSKIEAFLSEKADHLFLNSAFGFGDFGMHLKGDGKAFLNNDYIQLSQNPQNFYTIYNDFTMSMSNCPGIACHFSIVRDTP
jgi:hypothetical protein